jgi:hypothetical protein
MVEHMKALDKDSNEPLLKKLKSHLMNMLHHDNNVRVTTLAVRAVDMMRRYGLSMFMRNQVGVVVVVMVVVVVVEGGGGGCGCCCCCCCCCCC